MSMSLHDVGNMRNNHGEKKTRGRIRGLALFHSDILFRDLFLSANPDYIFDQADVL